MLKEPISAMGCGRTDAQVHASQYFFHIDVKNSWDYDLLFRVNKMLPDDIAVFEIIPMQDHQSARYDAIQRRYDYFIHTYKDPFLNKTSAWYPEKKLNIDSMKKAVSLLTKYNDYRAFCKSPNAYQHTICKVSSAILFTDSKGDRLRFQISSDRFLWRMVRLIVGKLIEVGKGTLSVDEFESYLITRETPKILDVAYPQGLFLSKVTYPYLEIPARTTFMSIGQPEEQWLIV